MSVLVTRARPLSQMWPRGAPRSRCHKFSAALGARPRSGEEARQIPGLRELGSFLPRIVELGVENRNSKNVEVPGCRAQGEVALLYSPLGARYRAWHTVKAQEKKFFFNE